jgi:Mor family transcriptional regulator
MSIPYGYVYRIVNKVNGKTYIGQHKILNESWRSYMGSGVKLLKDYDKYGKDRFVKQIICFARSAKSLYKKEFKQIRNELSKGHGEYNTFVNDRRANKYSRINPRKKKKSNHIFTDEEKSSVIDKYVHDGYSLPELGRQYHSSVSAISYILVSNDIPRHSKGFNSRSVIKNNARRCNKPLTRPCIICGKMFSNENRRAKTCGYSCCSILKSRNAKKTLSIKPPKALKDMLIDSSYENICKNLVIMYEIERKSIGIIHQETGLGKVRIREMIVNAGGSIRGRHDHYKFSDEVIQSIKNDYSNGCTIEDMTAKYHTAHKTLWRIVKNKYRSS